MRMSMAVMAACILGATMLTAASASAPPVVLVPGAGGNQLEARLSDDYHGSRFVCRTFGISYWFRLWLRSLSLLPPFTPCFAERIRLEYNAGSKKFHNPPGIETRVPGFGSTETMEYLDPTFKFLSPYMAQLVSGLKKRGLQSGKTLFGAPYDFRYAPGPNAADVALTFLKDLKQLVEKACKLNDGQPVVLLAHSLGGLWVLHFLNLQTLQWRQKYVSRFIAVATPWGGSVQEMLVFASGYSEGVSFIDPLLLRDEQRSSESNLWMLPVPKAFSNRTLLVTSSRTYSALDLKDFLQDIGYPQGVEHYKSRVPGLCSNLAAPLVPVSLVFGHGVDNTPETLVYKQPGFDYQPEMVLGEGDGTINLCSLTSVVPEWSSVPGQELRVVRVAGCNHKSILQDDDGVDQIVAEVFRSSGLSDSR